MKKFSKTRLRLGDREPSKTGKTGVGDSLEADDLLFDVPEEEIFPQNRPARIVPMNEDRPGRESEE